MSDRRLVNLDAGFTADDFTTETGSAVEITARRLRDDILQRAEVDVFLGSEEELMQRLAVSRTTFRQAIKLLEHEELVTIRRGVGGGFFTRRPSANAVAHMAAVYLIFQRTPLVDVLRTVMALRVEAVRQIALHADIQVRCAPRIYLEQNAEMHNWGDVREATRALNRYHLLVADLSGNKVLELFINVVRMFGNRSDALAFTRERLREHYLLMQREAEAMERGDTAVAEAIVREQLEVSLRWLAK